MFSWLQLSSVRVTVNLFIICWAPNHLYLQSKLSAAFKCKGPRSIITTRLESSSSLLWIGFLCLLIPLQVERCYVMIKCLRRLTDKIARAWLLMLCFNALDWVLSVRIRREMQYIFSLHIRSMWETICDAWACWSGWNFGPNSTEYPLKYSFRITPPAPKMKIVREPKSESFRIPPPIEI